MLLETIVNEMNADQGDVYRCHDGVIKTVLINDIEIDYISPPETLIVERYSEASRLYYSIVCGIVFEYEDRLIDIIKIGNTTIERADVWREFERFENYLNISNNKVSISIDDAIMVLARKEGSIIEAVKTFYNENAHIYDSEDVLNMLSKTMIEKISAEARQLNLIKNLKPVKSLF